MIHIEFYVLAMPKMVAEYRLRGGVEELKDLDPNKSYFEDEQIATFRFLNINQLYRFIFALEELGLHYDEKANYSEDFAVYSFLGLLWEAEWLQTNLYQLWMKGSH